VDNDVFVSNESSTRVKVQNCWSIITQIASGLAFVHRHGQVHRDLKPQNSNFHVTQLTNPPILYSQSENKWKIADFGCATVATSTNSRCSSRGTTSYRAPETILESGGDSYKIDIWSLGCILFELATYCKAFSGDLSVYKYASGQSELVVMVPWSNNSLTVSDKWDVDAIQQPTAMVGE
jgi:serine/threonine protein kinase